MTGDGPRFSKPIDKPTAKPVVEDADLALVFQAWPRLPAPVKAGILAMIRASMEADSRRLTDA
ncbi:MAG: hypothetical protein AMS14_07810 [Planctomycetes bacterium DG_20]|nr:MAG: hypothetical protein AMS14_07810 [Planctomycetes bacterium DG_20]